MSFVFRNDTLIGNGTVVPNYRCQLFVNGYPFGKYGNYFTLLYFLCLKIIINPSIVSNLGPQTRFPVPEGILNYNGMNYFGITLWALDTEGAELGGLNLVPEMPLWSGYRRPNLSPQPP
jgi:beta-galactosidase